MRTQSLISFLESQGYRIDKITKSSIIVSKVTSYWDGISRWTGVTSTEIKLPK